MARKVNVTLQFIRPFKPGRPDLSLRINEYTNTELFVNNATKQSKIPSQEKFELFDGPVLLPPEELVEACHAFIGSGDKSLPFDNVAYTDNGDAAVVLGASHTEDVSPPGADVDGDDSEEDAERLSKSAKKCAKRGAANPWLGNMKKKTGMYIPLQDNGLYLMAAAAQASTPEVHQRWITCRYGLYLQLKTMQPHLTISEDTFNDRLNKVLHYRNKHWSEAAREREASQLLQKAWEQSELPDYIRRNLKLENMIYVDCMRVAAAHGPTAGKESGVVDLCNDLCSPKAPKRLASSSVKVKVEQATGQKSTKKREPEPLEPAGEPKRGFFTKELINEVKALGTVKKVVLRKRQKGASVRSGKNLKSSSKKGLAEKENMGKASKDEEYTLSAEDMDESD